MGMSNSTTQAIQKIESFEERLERKIDKLFDKFDDIHSIVSNIEKRVSINEERIKGLRKFEEDCKAESKENKADTKWFITTIIASASSIAAVIAIFLKS